MEREIVLSDIKVILSKQAEQAIKSPKCGLLFVIGKVIEKTSELQNAGRQPKWKESITLTYYDQPYINVTIRGQNEKVIFGDGKIEVKPLKSTGAIEHKLYDDGEYIGTFFSSYSVKILPARPVLIITNISMNFIRQTKQMQNTTPYLKISNASSKSISTYRIQGKPQFNICHQIFWDDILHFKIKEDQEVEMGVYSGQQKGDVRLFSVLVSAMQFRILGCRKQVNIIDDSFQPLGTLSFDFETHHYVSRDEALQNEQKNRKQGNQLSEVVIQQVSGSLSYKKQGNETLLLRFMIGMNYFDTPIMHDQNNQCFKIDVKQSLHLQTHQTKMFVILLKKHKQFGHKNSVLGYKQIKTCNLDVQMHDISILNNSMQQICKTTVILHKNRVQAWSLKLSDIRMKLKAGNDIIGVSEPYLVATIGTWRTRTETLVGEDLKFARQLKLKYSSQQCIKFQVWEEDIAGEDKIYQDYIYLSSFNRKSGEMRLNIKETMDGTDRKGQITLRYVKKLLKNYGEDRKLHSKMSLNKKKSQMSILQGKSDDQILEEGKKAELTKINKSKSTNNLATSRSHSSSQLRLPAITDRAQYGDRIYQNKSAGTLQKSVVSFSMPKSSRFTAIKDVLEPSYYTGSSFGIKHTRCASFGFGEKQHIPLSTLKNMKNPAPGAYDKLQIIQQKGKKAKGPSFGIPHKYYQKVIVPKTKK